MGTDTGKGKRMLEFYQTQSFFSVCLYVCKGVESVTDLENSVLKDFSTLGRPRLRGALTKGSEYSTALSFTCEYISKYISTAKKWNINYVDICIPC